MTPKSFAELGLSEDLLKAIRKLGFEQAAPIQAQAIPLLLQGHDVAGQSQTGSGKTAAFAAPAIEKVDVSQRVPQVLVLCPTRELAIQVSEEVHKLAFFKRGLHALPVYGGQSYDRQLIGLRQGAQIIIGTPGRVMDHMRRGTLRLSTIKMVVLDEVDVMLNMGFREDIETILQATPKERQTVFFSATIPRPIQQLIEKYSREPKQVRIEQKALTVPTVEQVYYEVDRRYKVELLARLIDLHDFKLGIIFCNTKRMVDDLVDHLNAQGYSADRLHGDMNQAQRDRVMQKFRKSNLEFLVATDVAARGIDVDDVEVVFNYDLPYDGEDYVHRIGRTGRRGRNGRAISFASGREVFQIRNIERYTNMRIQRGQAPTEGEVEEARTMVFLDRLRATLRSGEYKRHDRLIERLLEEGFSTTDIASALLSQLQGGEAVPSKIAPTPAQRPPQERPPENSQPVRPPERPPQRPPERPAERLRPNRVPELPMKPAPLPVNRETRLAPPPPPPKARVAVPVAVAPLPLPKPVLSVPSVPAAPAAKHAPSATAALAPRPAPKPIVPVVVAQKPAPKPAPSVTAAPTPKPVPAVPAFSTAPAPVRKSRPKAEPFQTRLWLNIGSEAGVEAADIVNTISGETGLPGDIVGNVDIRERHLFVDVAAEHAHAILARLNRTQIKQRKIKAKAA